ncbi:hypothetical protein ACFQ7F_17055 [Streptomyces sp. NPDC056486]|uniref:hypothetical protein n=1 Tax=Streptomyces sp. NPDC056486 TaxID=3345835 RepID=UPI003684B9A4
MLLRLAYLTVTNLFAALRLLPMSDRCKDAEVLSLCHQLTVLERQLGTERTPAEDHRAHARGLRPRRQVLPAVPGEVRGGARLCPTRVLSGGHVAAPEQVPKEFADTVVEWAGRG